MQKSSEALLKKDLVNRWCRLFTVSVFLLLFAIGSVSLHAQQTGSLTGTILDPKGNVLQNAAVSVKNESTGVVRNTTADAQGHFSLTGLPIAKYTVEASAPGFASTVKRGLQLTADQPQDVSLTLLIAAAADQVTVEAANANSIAAQLAPMDGLLEARSARTEISTAFIQNFTSPISDYSELLQMSPGTFSINSNGIGLGDSKTYFRGFADGNYDITFDGIPFNDTNSPTHHSWAFFPSQWIGGVDFDRSPGTASTVGPTPFGGSINLLSKEMPTDQSIRGGVSYGSFNTLLYDAHYDSGNFGGRARRSNLFIDQSVHPHRSLQRHQHVLQLHHQKRLPLRPDQDQAELQQSLRPAQCHWRQPSHRNPELHPLGNRRSHPVTWSQRHARRNLRLRPQALEHF